MDGINVISINPGQATRAAKHPEVFERIARECKLDTAEARSRHTFRDCLNFLTGINGRVSSGMSVKLLSLRVITGAISLALGVNASLIGMSSISGLISIIFGSLLIAGLLSRIASTAVFCLFSYSITVSAMDGTFNSIDTIPAFIALVSMIMGPGFYSCDRIIRKSLLRGMRRRTVKRKMQIAEDRLSYKAFATTNYH